MRCVDGATVLFLTIIHVFTRVDRFLPVWQSTIRCNTFLATSRPCGTSSVCRTLCGCIHLSPIYNITHVTITFCLISLSFGMAASMGAFLLGAGAKGKRRALPNSRIMIHQPLGGAQGQAADIEIQVRCWW